MLAVLHSVESSRKPTFALASDRLRPNGEFEIFY